MLRIKRIIPEIHCLEELENLCREQHIRLEQNLDYIVGVYDGDQLVGTGALYLNIIKCLAIDEAFRGGTVFNLLVSDLSAKLYERGYETAFVYTKPNLLQSFTVLGFKEIARIPDKILFLEKSVLGFPVFLDKLQQQRKRGERIAAIVMNANPFTKGHLYLVETAAAANEHVHLFVVSEDVSLFPTTIRKQLVTLGTAHLQNVYIHDTASYIVSQQTFPAYFLAEDEIITALQGQLDATIFLQIASVLGITVRYVGEEPYSHTTAIYNSMMQEVFAHTIDFVVLPRSEYELQPISASAVRAFLALGNIRAVQQLVPETTYHFLISEEGQKLIKNYSLGERMED